MNIADVIRQLHDFTLKVVPDPQLNETIKKGIFPVYGSSQKGKAIVNYLAKIDDHEMDFTQLNEIIVHVMEVIGSSKLDEIEGEYSDNIYIEEMSKILEALDHENENLNISACAILPSSAMWLEKQSKYDYFHHTNYFFLIRFNVRGLENSDDVLNLLFQTDFQKYLTLMDLVSDSSIKQDLENKLPIKEFIIEWWFVLLPLSADPFDSLERDAVIRRAETPNAREQGIGHQSHKHAYVNEFQDESDLFFWESLAQWIFMFQDHSSSDLLPNEFMTKFMGMVARDIFHLDEHMVIKVRRHTYNNVLNVHLTSQIQAQYQHGHIYILYKDMPNLKTFVDYEKIVKNCGKSMDQKTCFVYVGSKKPKSVGNQIFITRYSFQDAVQMFYGNESSSPPQEPSTDHGQSVSRNRENLFIRDSESDYEIEKEDVGENGAQEQEHTREWLNNWVKDHKSKTLQAVVRRKLKNQEYHEEKESAGRIQDAYRARLAKTKVKHAREERAEEHAREERARAEEHAREFRRDRMGRIVVEDGVERGNYNAGA